MSEYLKYKKSVNGKNVSVVIPVYNDYPEVTECLDALREQLYPASRMEVIVVDNNSDVPLESQLEAYSDMRVVREEKQGSYAARNRGIEAASHEILAFTDADCVPEPQWVEKGVDALENKNADLVGGNIKRTFQGDTPNAFEHYDLVHYLNQDEYVLNYGFAATANLFVRRSVFEEVGRFDDDLSSGGDKEFVRRAVQAGSDLVFGSEATVRHEARSSFRELWNKVRRTKAGSQELVDKQWMNTKSKTWRSYMPVYTLPTLPDTEVRGTERMKAYLVHSFFKVYKNLLYD